MAAHLLALLLGHHLLVPHMLLLLLLHEHLPLPLLLLQRCHLLRIPLGSGHHRIPLHLLLHVLLMLLALHV